MSMNEYFKFWAAKLIVDSAIPLAFAALCLVLGGGLLLVVWIMQKRCEHEYTGYKLGRGITCRKCGKDKP